MEGGIGAVVTGEGMPAMNEVNTRVLIGPYKNAAAVSKKNRAKLRKQHKKAFTILDAMFVHAGLLR